MKIDLWFCESVKQWKWILTKSDRPILKQKFGQNSRLKDALQDIENTVEYLLEN